MELGEILSLVSLSSMALGALGLLYAWRSARHSDSIAHALLAADEERDAVSVNPGTPPDGERRTQKLDPLASTRGVLVVRHRSLLTGIGVLGLCVILVLSPHLSVGALLMVSLLGLSVGYLIHRALERSIKRAVQREVDFFLPIVMERLVMAVEAGLDVLPAMKRIIEIDAAATRSSSATGIMSEGDPVTRLLRVVVALVESGMSFEEALSEVSRSIEAPALKHAFVHLAVAHREGGELVMPLRELSDATQLYYQETVEEEIAKLPVRATVPLLCTFAGLILFFITTPLMQVLGLMSNAMPK